MAETEAPQRAPIKGRYWIGGAGVLALAAFGIMHVGGTGGLMIAGLVIVGLVVLRWFPNLMNHFGFWRPGRRARRLRVVRAAGSRSRAGSSGGRRGRMPGTGRSGRSSRQAGANPSRRRSFGSRRPFGLTGARSGRRSFGRGSPGAGRSRRGVGSASSGRRFRPFGGRARGRSAPGTTTPGRRGVFGRRRTGSTARPAGGSRSSRAGLGRRLNPFGRRNGSSGRSTGGARRRVKPGTGAGPQRKTGSIGRRIATAPFRAMRRRRASTRRPSSPRGGSARPGMPRPNRISRRNMRRARRALRRRQRARPWSRYRRTRPTATWRRRDPNRPISRIARMRQALARRRARKQTAKPATPKAAHATAGRRSPAAPGRRVATSPRGRTGTPVPTRPINGGRKLANGRAKIDSAAEAVDAHIGRYTPESAEDLLAFMGGLPEFFNEGGTSFRRLAQHFGGDQPLDRAVSEAIDQMSVSFAGMRDLADEANRLLRQKHEVEIKRIEDPRPNEQMWNT